MEELYTYLNNITPISAKTWDLLKGIFVQKEMHKLDYLCKVDKVATKIAFLQKGIVRSFYTNNEGQELNKNFYNRKNKNKNLILVIKHFNNCILEILELWIQINQMKKIH